MKNIILGILLLVTCWISVAQSVATSPYSVYGLGSLFESNFGSIPALGSSGIALPSATFINNKNPASLGHIGKHSFFFDIGMKGNTTTYTSQTATEKRNNFQFSHIAIAFPITSKSGFSVSLKPYSSATYLISNLQIPIGNSNEYYTLDAQSSGGLSNFDTSFGYKVHKNISFGLTTSSYFGTINDNKDFTIANSITNINKKSFYKGLRLTLGNQIKIDSTLGLGFTVKTPAKLSASKTQSVTTTNVLGSVALETDLDSDVVAYYLPLEIGVGLIKKLYKNINLSLDYEKSYWNATNQSSTYGEFKNQDKIALGVSYFKKEHSFYFSDRIKYFAGFNYDNGYLAINNKSVTNRALSLGIGIPIENTKSLLNISYSYGQKGSIGNDFVKESYHKIGINLSLEAIWFVKRKFE